MSTPPRHVVDMLSDLGVTYDLGDPPEEVNDYILLLLAQQRLTDSGQAETTAVSLTKALQSIAASLLVIARKEDHTR